MSIRSIVSRGGFGLALGLGLIIGPPGCSEDPEERPSSADPAEIDLALASLSVSVGDLEPSFGPEVGAYAVAFEGSATATLVAVARNPDATVTINGVAGGEQRLRTPLGTTEVVVTVAVGAASRDHRVTLTRSGDYVAEPAIQPPDEPPMDEENPNLKGYGFPTVSPDGRFIALQLSAPTTFVFNRYIDVYRADGPDIVFEKRLENPDLPVAFCDRDPGCLWTYAEPFDDKPGRWQFTLWGDGGWSEKGPSWEWSSSDPSPFLLDVDAPYEALSFDPENGGETVPLLADGTIGTAGDAVPGLVWMDTIGGHVVSKDRSVLIHTNWDDELGAGPGLSVYGRSPSGWTLEQTIAPAEPTPYFGSAMLLSDDGKELYVGDSWAIVDGLQEAGAVYHYTMGPSGFELAETFEEPTPRAGAGFGGFLRGDAATGVVFAGAVDAEPFAATEWSTLVYSLREPDAAHRLKHPGGVLKAPRDVRFFAGVSHDDRGHGVLNVYR